jgi:hypothetical protein
MPNYVHEITVVAPDIICIEYRDEDPIPGEVIALGAPDAEGGAQDAWLNRTHPTRGTTLAQVIGKDRGWLFFGDGRGTTWLDRAATDNVANWGTIGGRTVESVHRYSKPIRDGMAGTSPGFHSQFNHRVYLKLDGALAQGSHTIVHPDTTIADSTFVYNYKTTRCRSLKTPPGHRPEDTHKKAFLSEWIWAYGTEGGAVEFADTYNITEAYIINSDGGIVSDALPVTLRIDPFTPETYANAWWRVQQGHDASDGLQTIQYYTDMTRPVIANLEAITQANPAVLTAPGHGLSVGDLFAITGVDSNYDRATSGLSIAIADFLHSRYYRVATVPTSDTLTVTNISNGSALDTSGVGSGIRGGTSNGGKLRHIIRLNRAGTYNYEIDYSGVDLAPGRYRVYIPNLGVSDLIEIYEGWWHTVAKTLWKGLYNQRNGMAIDPAIGGFDRPISFRNGVNGVTHYASELPGFFSNENGFAGGFDSNLGNWGNWSTDTVVDWWGGHQDAADWDSILNSHAHVYMRLCDLVEYIPAARTTNFGCPQSADVIGDIYTGLTLPDLLNEAVWGLDTWRRNQLPDGSVYSSQQYGSRTVDPTVGANAITGGGGRLFEGSWNWRFDVHLTAPDHISTMMYVAAAAKMSKCFRALGHDTVADIWLESADAAWDWVDTMRNNFSALIAHYDYVRENAGWVQQDITNITDNGSGKCRLTVADTTGFTSNTGTYGIAGVVGTTEANVHSSLQVTVVNGTTIDLPGINFVNAYVSGGKIGPLVRQVRRMMATYENERRVAASLSMMAAAVAAGDSAMVAKYKAIGEVSPLITPSSIAGVGQWDYQWCTADATSATRTAVRDLVRDDKNTVLLRFDAPHAFEWVMRGQQNQHDDSYDTQSLIWGHQLETDETKKAKCLKALKAHLGHVLGANAHGRSMCTGLGYRNFCTTLQADSQLLYGSNREVLPGRPHLTYTYRNGGDAKSSFNFAISIRNNPYSGSLAEINRSMTEPYAAVPNMEAIYETPWAIDGNEYTIGGQTMPWLTAALYLHAYDGNEDTSTLPTTLRVYYNTAD